jgi:hypothetical protein
MSHDQTINLLPPTKKEFVFEPKCLGGAPQNDPALSSISPRIFFRAWGFSAMPACFPWHPANYATWPPEQPLHPSRHAEKPKVWVFVADISFQFQEFSPVCLAFRHLNIIPNKYSAGISSALEETTEDFS